jgi:hypothetical protein
VASLTCVIDGLESLLSKRPEGQSQITIHVVASSKNAEATMRFAMPMEVITGR